MVVLAVPYAARSEQHVLSLEQVAPSSGASRGPSASERESPPASRTPCVDASTRELGPPSSPERPASPPNPPPEPLPDPLLLTPDAEP
jgi:hypothetical protein